VGANLAPHIEGRRSTPFYFKHARFGFALMFLAVALMAFGKLALKGTALLAGGSGEEVRHAHIHAHHWSIW
jgi:hypothetical protein